MVFKESTLFRKWEKLNEYFNDIYTYKDLSLSEYLKQKNTKYAIERLLFLIAETILDFLEHILASKFDVISESYEDIIKNAMKYEIITENLYKDLKGLGSFRNILAHEYLELNDEQVYQNMKKMIKISDRVLKELKDQIFMK